MRFYVEYLNKNAISKDWLAKHTVEKLILMSTNDKETYFSLFPDESLQDQLIGIISEAEKAHSTFIKTMKPTYDVLKSVLLLAQVDVIYRAKIVDKNLGIVDDKDIEDLENIFSLIDTETFKRLSNNYFWVVCNNFVFHIIIWVFWGFKDII